mmetsp:Transcript_15190/g.49318  ORF Transcript_15190/g.49318 Transcript_15190/m.49318 type:complete len:348 (+) Transcript_15190:525-1568(+)
MKSAERLLSAACARDPRSKPTRPITLAPAWRELTSRRQPRLRSVWCFHGAPAEPTRDSWSQCAYSVAARPTPPAAAWTRSARRPESRRRSKPAWTVPQVLTNVLACSKLVADGLRTCKRLSARAREARQPTALPNDAAPIERCPPPPAPRPRTTPEQSVPGSTLGPGYSSSTISTSRKFRPTAHTCSSTSDAASGASNGRCASTRKSAIAPRPAALRQMASGKLQSTGAASLGACSNDPRRTASLSTDGATRKPCTLPPPKRICRPPSSLATLATAASPSKSKLQTGSCSSARHARDKPHIPACAHRAAEAPATGWAMSVHSHTGTGAACDACHCTALSAPARACRP